MTDWDLLDAYVSQQSEAAFTKLVERHWRMVLAVCRREVGDACLAEDAAQAAFLVLARRARSLRRKGDLASWLFVTARFTAKNAHRLEVRRKALERSAAEAMEPAFGDAKTAWPDLEPHLNEAIASLRPPDRATVLLCYFEGLSAREVALEFGITEGAVRTRLSRAIERLRKYFHRRGLFMTNMALADVLINQQGLLDASSVTAAHVARLAVESAANSASFPASSTLAHLLKGAYQQMLLMKLKLAVCVAGAVVLAWVGSEAVVQAIARGHLGGASAAIRAASPTASSLVDMTAPVATETRGYNVSDIYTGGPASTGNALPTDMSLLTDQGEVSVTRTTANLIAGRHYSNYAKINVLASMRGIRSLKGISISGADSDGRLVGRALPAEVPILMDGGQTIKLSMPSAFQSGFASCIAGNMIGGGVNPKGPKLEIRPDHCCLWNHGKFVDLSPFIPADVRSFAYVRSIDTAGDVLLQILNSTSPAPPRYVLIRRDRSAVMLAAEEAFLNRRGQAIMWQQKVGARVRMYNCATGQERLVPALANLIQGGVADFNDKGDILYISGAGDKLRYYVLSGNHVIRLTLPDKPLDFVCMNNRRQIAGRAVGADNKQHIMLFSPK